MFSKKTTAATVPATTTTTAAPKAPKAKAVPKPKASAKAITTPTALTPNQVRLLTVIAASKTPITYTEMRKATGMKKGLSKAVGTPSKEASASHTLLAKGFVQVVNKSVPYTFSITAAGKAMVK